VGQRQEIGAANKASEQKIESFAEGFVPPYANFRLSLFALCEYRRFAVRDGTAEA